MEDPKETRAGSYCTGSILLHPTHSPFSTDERTLRSLLVVMYDHGSSSNDSAPKIPNLSLPYFSPSPYPRTRVNISEGVRNGLCGLAIDLPEDRASPQTGDLQLFDSGLLLAHLRDLDIGCSAKHICVSVATIVICVGDSGASMDI